MIGHKGMVQAAVYIRNKLKEENLIERALNHNPARNTQKYGLVVVGHSLGGSKLFSLYYSFNKNYFFRRNCVNSINPNEARVS